MEWEGKGVVLGCLTGMFDPGFLFKEVLGFGVLWVGQNKRGGGLAWFVFGFYFGLI